MKKFFYIFVLTLASITAVSAQTPEQRNNFIIQTFPSYMVDYVLNNSVVVYVDETYAKEHRKAMYQYTDLNGRGYYGGLRVGDTILVFRNQAFFSKGQNLFMGLPPVEPKMAKTKRQKAPRTEEQKAHNAETIKKIIQTSSEIIGNRIGGGIGTAAGSNPTIRRSF